ncbi:hypothetical protein SAMN05421773_104274 [Streptomyces aidingensis]|uniref:Uncharacterized protein n=1 Tax=Streptomyces aidingensis TaxID=910347 RepID=A0A1I1KKW3_9ACTN|nr:hypothetical protein SAMN05421773_104274 [Streptomyces aidingensis]
MARFNERKPSRPWTAPEVAQVAIGVIGLVIALAAIVVQCVS